MAMSIGEKVGPWTEVVSLVTTENLDRLAEDAEHKLRLVHRKEQGEPTKEMWVRCAQVKALGDGFYSCLGADTERDRRDLAIEGGRVYSSILFMAMADGLMELRAELEREREARRELAERWWQSR